VHAGPGWQFIGRVNSIIATLGTFSACKGLALVVSGGQSKGYVLGNSFYVFIARGALMGIPATIWIFAVVSAVLYVLLRFTDIGRNLYAIGGNDRREENHGPFGQNH
jgi:ribose transport system permease protein